jgi:hypothetical protein
MGADLAISNAYPKMASYASDIARVSANLGIDASWLANAINFESGGNPQARNKYTNATGLIQFMPSTATGLGTTVDALYAMSGSQQMVWVEKYFARQKGKLKSQEDVYMAIFYPAYVGQPDKQFPASVTAVNPGIFTPRDYVKMANARAKLVNLIGVTGEATAYRALPALLFAGVVGGVTWWFLKRRKRR